MSNDNIEIYPLDEYEETTEYYPHADGAKVTRRRSVNERLAPIFNALDNDPVGWEYEVFSETDGWKEVYPHEWWNCLLLPDQQKVEYFRLTREKPKTITVEIDTPDDIERVEIGGAGYDGYVVKIPYAGYKEAEAAAKAIRKAMEDGV